MKYDNQQQDPLQAQLKTLEMEWDSIKQSFSRSDRRNLATNSTATATTTTAAAAAATVNNRLFQLQDNSPKEIMSLLQHESCDFDNFDNGRLMGRRLFEESEMGSDNGGCLDVAGEHEVSTEFSYKGCENDDENDNQFSGRSCVSSPPGRKKGVVMVAVKHGGGGSGSGGGGGSVRRWMMSMTWIGVVIMMFALGIVAFKCKGEDEQFLVPT